MERISEEEAFNSMMDLSLNPSTFGTGPNPYDEMAQRQEAISTAGTPLRKLIGKGNLTKYGTIDEVPEDQRTPNSGLFQGYLIQTAADPTLDRSVEEIKSILTEGTGQSDKYRLNRKEKDVYKNLGEVPDRFQQFSVKELNKLQDSSNAPGGTFEDVEFMFPNRDQTVQNQKERTYNFGDLTYDWFIDPVMTVGSSASELATNILLSLDTIAVNHTNKESAKRGEAASMNYGESGFGKFVEDSNIYLPHQVLEQMQVEIESARAIEDPEDRLETAKNILGEYGSMFSYFKIGLEVLNKIPGVRKITKPIGQSVDNLIRKNPAGFVATELAGVAAETELTAQGYGEGVQAVGGMAATLGSPLAINKVKKLVQRNLAGDVMKNMKQGDWDRASKILQSIADPEKGISNLKALIKTFPDGKLPQEVSAPLEMLLGDKKFTYLEKLLETKKIDGFQNLAVRDNDFINSLGDLLRPVSSRKIRNTEDWLRLSKKMHEQDLKKATTESLNQGFNELNKLTNGLPEANAVASTYEGVLQQAKSNFGYVLDKAWDLADGTIKLPKRLLDDYNKPLSGSLDIKIGVDNVIGNLNKMGEYGTQALDGSWAMRWDHESFLKDFDKLRDSVISVDPQGLNKNKLIQLRELALNKRKSIQKGAKEAGYKGNTQNLSVDESMQYLPLDKRGTYNFRTGDYSKGRKDPEKVLTAKRSQQALKESSSNLFRTLDDLKASNDLDEFPSYAQKIMTGEVRFETVDDLLKAYRRLGDEGMQAMRDGAVGPTSRISNLLRMSIMDDLASMKTKSPAMLNAQNLSRTFKSTFSDGVVGNILKMTSKGNAKDSRQALQGLFSQAGSDFKITGRLNVEALLNSVKQFNVNGKAFDMTSETASEDALKLIKNYKKTGNLGQMENTVGVESLQNYMMNLFTQAGAGGGTIMREIDGVPRQVVDPVKTQQFLNKYKQILDIPEMRKVKGIISTSIGDESSGLTKKLNDVKNLKEAFSGKYGTSNLGALNAYFGDDVSSGISTMMKSKGGALQLESLQKLIKESPDKYFSDMGLTKNDVLNGLKESVYDGILKIGRDKGSFSDSLLVELVSPGKNKNGVLVGEGALLPLLKQAGFNPKEIKNVQNFADKVQQFNRYNVSKQGSMADVLKSDNIFNNLVALVTGSAGASVVAGPGKLATASYLKRQVNKTLSGIQEKEAMGILTESMQDPKLLEELLRTPTVFNKNALMEKSPLLYKFLVSRGIEGRLGMDDKEIEQRIQEYSASPEPGLIDSFLQGQSAGNAVNLSNVQSFLQSDRFQDAGGLPTSSKNPLLNAVTLGEGALGFGEPQRMDRTPTKFQVQSFLDR